jgi:hypothetical protein
VSEGERERERERERKDLSLEDGRWVGWGCTDQRRRTEQTEQPNLGREWFSWREQKREGERLGEEREDKETMEEVGPRSWRQR